MQLSKSSERGGFRLSKWLTTYDSVPESVPDSCSIQYSVPSLVVPIDTVHHVLGVVWNVERPWGSFKR